MKNTEGQVDLLRKLYADFPGTRQELAERIGMSIHSLDMFRKMFNLKKSKERISELNRTKALIKAKKERERKGGMYETN